MSPTWWDRPPPPESDRRGQPGTGPQTKISACRPKPLPDTCERLAGEGCPDRDTRQKHYRAIKTSTKTMPKPLKPFRGVVWVVLGGFWEGLGSFGVFWDPVGFNLE